ncbi:flagellar filament capping protein FliD [Croceicoccus hydrothermalis]|uniref:flagellar filament capping protein FliD n=1 Tax=Croceicoccus hydrothermalis TaxID=2867964 RepID=UPI001EFAAE9B|nr:flagellar filament capping protein FliD [Croceicoccus hydrothermalis]
MDSSTTSIVSALGAGSGVDMAKLASDLAAARFAPKIAQLENRAETLDLRISSAATLKSSLNELASALGERIRTGDLAPKPTSSDPAVATAKVASGGTASGSYALEVTQLAKAQTLALAPYGAATDPVGEGTLTIRFGSTAGGTFAEDTAQTALSINVGAGDTLNDVANAINLAGGSVTAYVVEGEAGAQLVMKGAEGQNNGFVVEGTGASAGGGAPGSIDYLNWTPGTDSGQLKQASADALYTFDGVQMRSPTNSATNLPGGLSLTLTGVNAGNPATITFADRSTQIESMMVDFTAALNDIAGQLAQTAAPLGGELGNDPGARALKRDLSAFAGLVVMPNAAPGEPSRLSDLGLTRERDGTFRLDVARLKTTISDAPEATAAMFTTGLYGVFSTLDNLARRTSSATDPGRIGGSIKRYTRQREAITESLTKIGEQQDRLREQMTKTFAASDARVAQSQSTLSFLKSQIAVWNAAKD